MTNLQEYISIHIESPVHIFFQYPSFNIYWFHNKFSVSYKFQLYSYYPPTKIRAWILVVTNHVVEISWNYFQFLYYCYMWYLLTAQIELHYIYILDLSYNWSLGHTDWLWVNSPYILDPQLFYFSWALLTGTNHHSMEGPVIYKVISLWNNIIIIGNTRP